MNEKLESWFCQRVEIRDSTLRRIYTVATFDIIPALCQTSDDGQTETYERAYTIDNNRL